MQQERLVGAAHHMRHLPKEVVVLAQVGITGRAGVGDLPGLTIKFLLPSFPPLS